jgi:signal transduction histidine kinase
MTKMPNQHQADDASGLISSLMERIAGKEDSTRSSFPITIIAISILVLVVAVMGVKLAWTKRKAAELAVKVRRAEEEKERAKENIELSVNAAEREASQEEVKALGKEILDLKAKIADRQTQHTKDMKQLEGVTSWDDVIVVDSSGRWDG